ncbi:hypothetical protein [Gordonia sp. 'Campus']|uniref:hypothetical protein n=1 Tax=Gordonia sp. 'Campus' TaxID=2915824 RepID=UPI001EE474AC|nr:hypothetical protein [Gordonia sp. 'Campus']
MTSDCGVFTLNELTAMGWTADDVKKARRGGTLTPIGYGGWDEVLDEIRALTRPDRHRIRRRADTRRTDPS